MTTKVFVDGQEGTTGLRIFEYLAARPDIDLLHIDETKRKDPGERRRLINASDVTFLCLPDAASREAVTLADNARVCIIDASAAFRTDPNWAYGLPELLPTQRDRIRSSKRIAVPGCHASAFLLAVRPLVEAGVLPADTLLHCYSLTGYSGGGKKMIADYQAPRELGHALESPRPYALTLKHKHLPEMQHHGRLASAPIFVPVVADFYKGLAVTVFLHRQQLVGDASPAKTHACLSAYYQNEPFVQVAPLSNPANLDNGFFDVQACNDTNRVDLFVFGNAERIIVTARLDNLGKGASGAAIQCMNLRIGADETVGLI